MLKKMGYPDDKEEILIDEFQAYYYTEKKNFFGKNLQRKYIYLLHCNKYEDS